MSTETARAHSTTLDRRSLLLLKASVEAQGAMIKQPSLLESDLSLANEAQGVENYYRRQFINK